MSEVKHTPGPWTADLKEAEAGNSIAVISGGSLIASVIGADEFPCLEGEEIEGFDIITKANSQLIAAAPELLAACIQAKDYLIADVVEPGRTVFWKLIDAIKKAEGR